MLETITTEVELKTRQANAERSTCGYETGDPSKERNARPGFICTMDAMRGLWGFCVNSTYNNDCGFAGACVDLHDCSAVCSAFRGQDIVTTSWLVKRCAPQSLIGHYLEQDLKLTHLSFITVQPVAMIYAPRRF